MKKVIENRSMNKKLKYVYFGLDLLSNVLTVYAATDDPIQVVNNLSNFIFGIIRALGAIMIGFGVMQFGLSFKSHDPSQRANSALTVVGGIIVFFAKEILNIITGG